MIDFSKIQKLLNQCSSTNDSEALSALRVAQKLLPANLGDYVANATNDHLAALAAKDALYKELEALFDAEVEKAAALKKQKDGKEKTLYKAQRDNQNLKRDVKAYKEQIEELEALLQKNQPQSPGTPAEQLYQNLEMLFDAEVEKNERLKGLLDQKDKSLKKAQRDESQAERELKACEKKIEKLEAMINELSEELIAFKEEARLNKDKLRGFLPGQDLSRRQ